jgi:rod shape-determining protein MreD
MPPDKPQAAAMAGVMLSFILAMLLRILPFPLDWFAWNPDWLALVVIYWTLLAPDRVGIVTAWLVGFLADVLTGRLFGQHALAYAVIAYANLQVRQKLLVLPMLVQSFWVLLLLLLAQLLILWTQRIEMAESMRATYWLPSLTGALAWPLVFGVIQRLGRLGLMRGS